MSMNPKTFVFDCEPGIKLNEDDKIEGEEVEIILLGEPHFKLIYEVYRNGFNLQLLGDDGNWNLQHVSRKETENVCSELISVFRKTFVHHLENESYSHIFQMGTSSEKNGTACIVLSGCLRLKRRKVRKNDYSSQKLSLVIEFKPNLENALTRKIKRVKVEDAKKYVFFLNEEVTTTPEIPEQMLISVCELPDEMLIEILKFCTTFDSFTKLCLICKRFNRLVNNEYFFYFLIGRDYNWFNKRVMEPSDNDSNKCLYHQARQISGFKVPTREDSYSLDFDDRFVWEGEKTSEEEAVDVIVHPERRCDVGSMWVFDICSNDESGMDFTQIGIVCEDKKLVLNISSSTRNGYDFWSLGTNGLYQKVETKCSPRDTSIHPLSPMFFIQGWKVQRKQVKLEVVKKILLVSFGEVVLFCDLPKEFENNYNVFIRIRNKVTVTILSHEKMSTAKKDSRFEDIVLMDCYNAVEVSRVVYRLTPIKVNVAHWDGDKLIFKTAYHHQ